MELSYYNQNDVCVIRPKGRLSAENVDVLRTLFLDLFKRNRRFVFDLTELENMDSTGLGALVFCMKSCTEFNGKFALSNVPDKPRMILEITKAYRIFDIYDNLETAIKATGSDNISG